MTSEVTVATFNLHAGIDGYGQRFDVIGACRALGAGVLVLQEVFGPLEQPSQAAEVAEELGYDLHELPLARAWRIADELFRPAGAGWEPRRPYPREHRALRVGGSLRRRGRGGGDRPGYDEGTWGIAVLVRADVATVEEVVALELGRLRRDFTVRAALSVHLGNGMTVVGTHMAHSTHGSWLHLRTLKRSLPRRKTPAVLAGDMNFWGPPIELALPGWRRAARGPTWPSWRPRHQLDHLFVTEQVAVLEGGPVALGNSDHLPVRATLSI